MLFALSVAAGVVTFSDSILKMPTLYRKATKGHIVSEEDNIKAILKEYSGGSSFTVSDHHWFSSVKGGKKDFLFLAYDEGTEKISDLFHLEGETIVRKFHDSNPYEHNKIKIGYYDDDAFVFIYTISGSGAFLSGNLYRFDEHKELRELSSIEGFYAGNVEVVDDKIVLSRGGQLFFFDLVNNNVELQPYTYHIKYPELGYNRHILRMSEKRGELVIEFDNNQIASFQPERFGRSLEIDAPISVGDELVILTSNLSFKVLASMTHFTFNPGIFTRITALKAGSTTIHLKGIHEINITLNIKE